MGANPDMPALEDVEACLACAFFFSEAFLDPEGSK
jgi:hypothetical protein